MKCRAESRKKWRDEFFRVINEFHAKEGTNPLHRNLWNEIMRDWIASCEDTEFQASPMLFHKDVRTLIRHQNRRIGWRQLINGRLSVEWSRLQDDHYVRIRSQRGMSDKHRGHRWQIKLILLIWK